MKKPIVEKMTRTEMVTKLLKCRRDYPKYLDSTGTISQKDIFEVILKKEISNVRVNILGTSYKNAWIYEEVMAKKREENKNLNDLSRKHATIADKFKDINTRLGKRVPGQIYFQTSGRGEDGTTKVIIDPEQVRTLQESPLEYKWFSDYKRAVNKKTSADLFSIEEFIPLAADKERQVTDEKTKETKSDPLFIPDLLTHFEEEPYFVVLGDGGAGKSTMLREYFFTLINKTTRGSRRIPVYIPLIRIKEYYKEKGQNDQLIKNLILGSINNLLGKTKKITWDDLEVSDCVLLFDGLDEITDPDLHRFAVTQINDLLGDLLRSPSSHNRFVLSCRIKNYESNSFPQLPVAYELRPFSDEQIKGYLAKCWNEEMATHILEKKLSAPKIRFMARKPFLLNLIVKHLKKDFKSSLPPNKGLLLEWFIKHLPEEKGNKNISVPPVREPTKFYLLSQFAYKMTDYKNGVRECPQIAHNNIMTSWRDVKYSVDDIVLRCEKERILAPGSWNGSLSFALIHFRDYFAATYIKDSLPEDQEKLKDFIKRHLEFKKWDEALEILVGIVDEEQSQEIMDLIADYDPHLAARCLLSAASVSLETRKKLFTLSGTAFFDASRRENITEMLLLPVPDQELAEQELSATKNNDSLRKLFCFSTMMYFDFSQQFIRALEGTLSDRNPDAALINTGHILTAFLGCYSKDTGRLIVPLLLRFDDLVAENRETGYYADQLSEWRSLAMILLGMAGTKEAVERIISCIRETSGTATPDPGGQDGQLTTRALIGLGIHHPTEASGILLKKKTGKPVPGSAQPKGYLPEDIIKKAHHHNLFPFFSEIDYLIRRYGIFYEVIPLIRALEELLIEFVRTGTDNFHNSFDGVEATIRLLSLLDMEKHSAFFRESIRTSFEHNPGLCFNLIISLFWPGKCTTELSAELISIMKEHPLPGHDKNEVCLLSAYILKILGIQEEAALRDRILKQGIQNGLLNIMRASDNVRLFDRISAGDNAFLIEKANRSYLNHAGRQAALSILAQTKPVETIRFLIEKFTEQHTQSYYFGIESCIKNCPKEHLPQTYSQLRKIYDSARTVRLYRLLTHIENLLEKRSFIPLPA